MLHKSTFNSLGRGFMGGFKYLKEKEGRDLITGAFKIPKKVVKQPQGIGQRDSNESPGIFPRVMKNKPRTEQVKKWFNK